MSSLYQARQHPRAFGYIYALMEDLVPRFYFHLASKDRHIPDDSDKALAGMNASLLLLKAPVYRHRFYRHY